MRDVHLDLGELGNTKRTAAAQARQWLVAQAAERLGVPVDQLQVRAGVVQVTADPSRQVAYGALLAGAHATLELADATVADLRVGGNFRWSNAEGFARLLEQGFPVRVERHPERIVLHAR